MPVREPVPQQAAAIDKLGGEFEQLNYYVAELLKARLGPRSERPDLNQLALFAQLLMAPGPHPPPSVETAVAGHLRSGGRSALLDHQVGERCDHQLAEHARACPDWGKRGERIGMETRH